MNNKNDELEKGKNFEFYFYHNDNKNIKTINVNNPLVNSMEVKGSAFFNNNYVKNKIIKRDIRGYPISGNYNKRYTNTKLQQNPLANSTNFDINRETVLNQISQLIDKKNDLNNLNNNNINLNNKLNFNPNSNTIKINKDLGGKCFQNIKITSIKNQKFENKDNLNKEYEINNHEYTPIGRSVISFSYNEEKNNRKEMQDFHKIVDKYINSNNKGYFSIFDGHGKGVIEPIKYAASRLPSIFSNFLISTHYNVEKSFIYSFQKIDDELKCYSQIENCGSTASLLYIDKEVGIVYSANVGDSKGILINKFKKYKILTTEHKCLNNNEEVQRIKNLGGLIFNGRLFGQLALTRALGDFSLKNNGLISTPSIYKNKILEDDIYIVVASDGVWDTLNEDEVSNICIDNANLNTDDLGKLIIKRAIEKGSEDNISCILIQVGNL